LWLEINGFSSGERISEISGDLTNYRHELGWDAILTHNVQCSMVLNEAL